MLTYAFILFVFPSEIFAARVILRIFEIFLRFNFAVMLFHIILASCHVCGCGNITGFTRFTRLRCCDDPKKYHLVQTTTY